MKETIYLVSGSAVSGLNTHLKEVLEVNELHAGDGFTVFYAENFSWWTASDMQTTIIVDRQSPDTAVVKTAVGGGATGFLQMTLGSEARILQKLESQIEDVFSDLDLSVEDPQTEESSPLTECEECGVLFLPTSSEQDAECSVCGGRTSPEE
jgi:hypothetical protein